MEADTQERKAAIKSKSASSKKTTITQKGKAKSATASATPNKESQAITDSRGKIKETDSSAMSKSTGKTKLMQKDSNQSLQNTADAISMEQRHQLIATVAYLRAEQRGFNGGDPMEDWLIAEHEVDATLTHQNKAGSKSETKSKAKSRVGQTTS